MSVIGVGCSSIVKSSKLELAGSQEPIAIHKAGYYFLPKVKIRLEGERKALLPVTEKEVTDSKEEQKDERGKITSDKSVKKTITKTTDRVQTQVEKSACKLALKETFTEPDPEYLYRLDHLRNYFAEDKVTVTFSPNGFLSKIDISAEDKTGEFVTKIAELAKESAKAFAAISPAKVKEEGPRPFYFSLVIDPADSADIKRVNETLDRFGCPIHVDSVRQKNPLSLDKDLTPDKNSLISDPLKADPTKANDRNGIYFRPALPYTLIFRSASAEEFESREIENTLYLPNKSPVMFLDFKRVAFGKYTHVIDFENGQLKQMTFSVPSSALGFMTIPIEVAKAIASIPGEILQLKFNVVSKQNDLLTKQAELIESQKKRLEAEEALRKYIEGLQKAKEDPTDPTEPSGS